MSSVGTAEMMIGLSMRGCWGRLESEWLEGEWAEGEWAEGEWAEGEWAEGE